MGRIVIFTRLEAAPGRRPELVAAFEPLLDAVAVEPGTAVFALHAAADEPDRLLCYEVYVDEAALARHRDSDAVRGLVACLAGLLARPPEITYAVPIRAVGLPGA